MVDLSLKLETMEVEQAVQKLLVDSSKQTISINRLLELMERMANIMDRQDDRITTLVNIVHDLAPEYELIEDMAENEDERKELLDIYMNHNDKWMQ